MFTVQLGSTLLLANFGITGIAATIAKYFLSGIIGVLIEDGTFLIDITLDSLKEGMKEEDFKKQAKDAYEKATAGVLDEVKKARIRRQYLDIISKIGVVGDGPK